MYKTIVALAVLVLVPSVASAAGTVFSFDLRGDDNFFSFGADTPMVQTQIGPVGGLSYATYAMDFDTAGSTLYVVNHIVTGVWELGTLDTATGTYTAGPAIPSITVTDTGLSVDPTDETFYLSTATSLYTLDPVTGNTSYIADFADVTGAPLGTVIDIAVDNSGQMYAHDIGADALWSIDKTTAVATLVGPSNLDANFAQGMDFDPTTNILYAAVYTGGGTGSYGTWDTTTGVITEILDLPSFPDPSGGGRELEMAIRVPEPASLSLLALGGLCLLRRR